MFGLGKKSDDTKSSALSSASAPNSLNALVKGTRLDGDIQADNDFRVDGEIMGNLTCKGKVIVGITGSVVGDIRCENATVEGSQKGNIFVSDTLTLRESATLEGDIFTDKLVVQSGAKLYNVKCHMGEGAHNKALSAKLPEAKKALADVH